MYYAKSERIKVIFLVGLTNKKSASWFRVWMLCDVER